jgi:cell division protein FtsB
MNFLPDKKEASMSKFWKTILTILIIIIIFAIVMLLITFLVPDVKAFAKSFAAKHSLPLWIVGFLAPIAYALKRLKEWLSNFLGVGKTEREIREENEAIKTEIKKLRQEVQDLDEWRRESIHHEMTEIGYLRQTLSSMEGRSHMLAERIRTLSETPAEDLLKYMTDKEIEKEIERRNAMKGIAEGGLRPIG